MDEVIGGHAKWRWIHVPAIAIGTSVDFFLGGLTKTIKKVVQVTHTWPEFKLSYL